LQAQSTVAVAVPVYQPQLDADDLTALRHLLHYLSAFDLYLVMPESLELSLTGFKPMRFSNRFLESRRGYSSLMLSTDFYRRFSAYEYVLVHQLDCLVVSNRLLDWCAKGYDYVAPVHTIGNHPPMVGNGGLSLRKVEGFLGVLTSKVRAITPSDYWVENWAAKPLRVRLAKLPRKYAKHFVALNGVRREIDQLNRADYGWAEDWFWTLRPEIYMPGFRRAPPNEGMRFAFNEAPRETFELIGRQLPFGCHGWTQFDRSFWEPHLLPPSVGPNLAVD
jgi:hypothetical protein